MADSLLVLIRLKEMILNERLKSLGNLYRLEQSLKNRKILLKKQLLEEEIASLENQIAALTFGYYVEWNIAENKRVDQSIITTQHNIDVVREQIRKVFKEKKVFEIIRKKRIEREQAELRRKENIFLDEIGLNLYRRRHNKENKKKKTET